MERDDSELLMLLSVAVHPSATAADAAPTRHIVIAVDTIDADNEAVFGLRNLTETGFGSHPWYNRMQYPKRFRVVTVPVVIISLADKRYVTIYHVLAIQLFKAARCHNKVELS